MKTWVKAVLGLVVLVLLIVVLVPLFVNANTFRPKIEKELGQALNRPVQLGNLSFSLFSGSLVADNVQIGDDPQFSSSPFLQAKSLHIGVQTGPLIFHKQLIITNFAANEPSIHLIHASNGTWNFSSIGKTAASQNKTPQTESSIPNLTVGEFAIHGGTATVESQPAAGPAIVYSNVELSIQNLSFAKQFPYKLTANLPAGGSVAVNGNAGPVSVADASDTPFSANLTLRNFNPVASGVIDASEGIGMVANVDAKAQSDGRDLSSTGTIHASHLQLVKTGSPTPQPVDVNYDVVNNMEARTGQVRDLQIRTGALATHATGTYRLLPNDTELNVKFSGQSLPINDLEALLPALGVKLPSGSKLQGGTLTTNLTINGSAKSPDISGPVDVEHTALAGFNLGSKLGGLASLGGVQTGNSTAIDTFKSNLTAASGGVRADNMLALIPALGTITGAGTVSPAGALDFRLLVKLNTKSGVGGSAIGVLSSFGGSLGKTASSATATGIPLTISGTQTDPHFSVNVQSLGKAALQGQAKGLLGGTLPNGAPKGKDLQNVNPGQLLQGLMGAKKH